MLLKRSLAILILLKYNKHVFYIKKQKTEIHMKVIFENA